MNDDERRALESLRFSYAPVPDDVWVRSPFHVDGLHEHIMRRITAGVAEAKSSPHACPIGVAMQGHRGTGKTHLLGLVRERVQADGGYFFLVSLLDGGAFWASVVEAVREGLLRPGDGGRSQLAMFLKRLAARIGVPPSVESAVIGETLVGPDDLSALVSALRRRDPIVGRECQDTLRALVLFGSTSEKLQDLGCDYLLSTEASHPADRAKWGIKPGRRSSELIVRDVSRLLALTGPTVIAVDQIDTLIAQSVGQLGRDSDADEPADTSLLAQIAGGLMNLRQVTRRTLTVVACLPNSWVMIKTKAVDTVADRFHEALQLKRIPTPAIGQAIIEKRFAECYGRAEFTPEYPTWPVMEKAFVDAIDFTPRRLMQVIDSHIQLCLSNDRVIELERLTEEAPSPPEPPVSGTGSGLSYLDKRFADLCAKAEVTAALTPAGEDVLMPVLLSAALRAYVVEIGDRGRTYAQDPPPGARPALHARLRRTLVEATEDEMHWAFRAISADHQFLAALNRLRNACTAAGLLNNSPKRRLFVLRDGGWNKGPKTRATVDAFTAAGGVVLKAEPEDLRTFDALRVLLEEGHNDLPAWLATRRHSSRSSLLRAVFGNPSGDSLMDASGPLPSGPAAGTTMTTAGTETEAGTRPGPRIGVGQIVDKAQPVSLDLESLRKHIAIFAGSGSGKTVLLRRLVEECALQGVSSIVLDPNNDLARLADSWPQEPESWGPGDADKARRYLAQTDVVVWTPLRDGGRPLALRPLPDFRNALDNADELQAALDIAVATLAPRAKVEGELNKALLGRAVLREALTYFARRGGSGLDAFVRLLAELPEGVSALTRAEKIAGDMAQTLRASMVTDRLFGDTGAPMDPGLLLTPPPGKKARVSVISFIGLPQDSQRQSFVNQLQMALFAWIKENPAGDRPLGGLFVMDEAQTLAPSGAMTACTQSTLSLASQARKYGLGLVFATQAPKGLHNRIVGNAATQFFGFLNSPVQIAAARDMAQAKGSVVLDISRLRTGQFYVAGEEPGFRKVQTPLCLTHHPRSPLTPEEVLLRSRGTGTGLE